MMWRKSFVIPMVLAFGVMLLMTPTQAMCEGELEGTWSVMMGVTDASGYDCWKECNLTIGSDGIIEGGTYEDCLVGAVQVTGGWLTLSPESDSINGTVETANGAIVIETGSILGNHSYLVLRRAEN